MGRERNWTDEEKNYLEENWGTLSISTIARNLGRSESGVINMKARRGLGAFLDNGDYISYSQLLKALYGAESASNAYRHNKRWEDFPVRRKRVGKCSFRVVWLQDFWKWAEENKHLLDFSKMEENILGEEPKWVKQKRKQDVIQARERTTRPWTDAEDRKLDKLVREGNYTIDQLASIFHRREQAVKRRMYDLCMDVRPPKNKKNNGSRMKRSSLSFSGRRGTVLNR